MSVDKYFSCGQKILLNAARYQDWSGVCCGCIGRPELFWPLGKFDSAEIEKVVPGDEMLLHVGGGLVAPLKPVDASLVVEEHGALALGTRSTRFVQVLCNHATTTTDSLWAPRALALYMCSTTMQPQPLIVMKF